MDDKKLQEIGEKVGRLDHADHILSWDRKQSIHNPDAFFCDNDADHGRLQIRGDGAALICCHARPPCAYQMPVSR